MSVVVLVVNAVLGVTKAKTLLLGYRGRGRLLCRQCSYLRPILMTNTSVVAGMLPTA
jgi:multidrug efflux pump subunit AcrB